MLGEGVWDFKEKEDSEHGVRQIFGKYMFWGHTKTMGKTTRPFKYDLNQIPYDYTVELRNRLKGLDLIDRVPDELWTEVRDIVLETGIKTIPMEKKRRHTDG